MEDLRCLAIGRAVADPGSIIDGGMVAGRASCLQVAEGWSMVVYGVLTSHLSHGEGVKK